jgi:hypothetical protein
MDATQTETTSTISTRGRPPLDPAKRAEYLANKGILPLTFSGRPKTEVAVSTTLALPDKDFEGRERLDKAARTIAGVAARSINERAGKVDADTTYKHQYITAQVIRLLSDNV